MDAAYWHGPLMVGGFFGTLIGLERAVALAKSWAFLAPIASGCATAALVAGFSPTVVGLAATAGAAILLAASLAVWSRQKALFTAIMAIGALCWLGACAAWLALGSGSAAAPLWMAFLVLTIAGERLELRRLIRPARWDTRWFLSGCGCVLAGAAWALMAPAGWWLLGLGLVLIAAWGGRYDVARRTIRGRGLVRYAAASLLAGYAWLGVAGGLLLAGVGAAGAGPGYDAVLHAVFLGFVFSMVFAHAPIILPAVVRLAVPYRSSFYLHLLLLHLSLIARLVGDLAGDEALRRFGSTGNVAAIVVFVLATAGAVIGERRRR